jgi:predicted GNAT family N-acyltransferase
VRELRFITPDSPLYAAELDLRFRVLREPLGHTRDAVTFPFEGESLHLVALEAERIRGCVLFHPESPSDGRLFQMAVEPALQGTGLGRQLVVHLEAELRRRRFARVHLHARATVQRFYEKLGYAVYGEPFTEVGIPHVHMQRGLVGGASG